MQEWYYSADGQQRGPVSLAELQERARSGKLDAARDLVWNAGMTEWLPAGRVPEIFSAAPSTGLAPSNPYAPPVASTLLAMPPDGLLQEIAPGSHPLDAIECLKRAFALVNRNLVPLVLVALAYFAVTFASQMVLGALTAMLGVGFVMALLLGAAGQVVSTFLMLGATRVTLNVVSGDHFEISQLFGGGSKIARALGPMVGFTVLLLIAAQLGSIVTLLVVVAAIYAFLRYGQYLALIVDKDMGLVDALKQSFRLTQNSTLPLLVLAILSGVIFFAGLLALLVGVLYTMPVWLVAQAAAYRWLQYGPVALADTPGTQTPVLQGRTAGSVIG